MKYVPTTKEELLSCYNSKKCAFMKGSAKSHVHPLCIFLVVVICDERMD